MGPYFKSWSLWQPRNFDQVKESWIKKAEGLREFDQVKESLEKEFDQGGLEAEGLQEETVKNLDREGQSRAHKFTEGLLPTFW